MTTSEPVPLTVIILTYNEEIHIERAVQNVIDWAQDVFVLDSYSNDGTCQKAEKLGAQVFYRRFDNYAAQRNYAIQSLPIRTELAFFLDADEYLSEPLKDEIKDILKQMPEGIEGFHVKRRFIFMGKWIKGGGYYPTWILRLFKRETAKLSREINEHVEVEGKVGHLKHDFIHDDLKGFSIWLDKHNRYATLEAAELARAKQQISDPFAKFWGTQAQRKRWIRANIWNRLLPPLIRPFLYFLYRYVLRLGFLDGRAGFIFHFFHGLVYPMMIDIKFIESRAQTRQEEIKSPSL